ncbi:Aldehyde dehydrogenase, thermostable (plasmid) [Aminobacter sp. MSH1]|uniref:aldehyde dehydrogenase family protein n=1 Tax=Aminobacter sp. MSH1 TaxID=374606 RepID=UPI000D349DFC|nr:aldehyde dehydrogenase family protein [Aminobacter sp. MSH1]AWC25831.1 Aldehyde dehydrogenase, thermostable [Aminobacter sp. MSH1]
MTVALSSERTGANLQTDPASFDRIIENGRKVRPEWRCMPVEARARILARLAELISVEKERFAQLLIREVGKPLGEARAEVDASVRMLEYFAGWPFWGRTGQVGVVSSLPEGGVLLKPQGLVGLITPWNYPLSSPVQKIAGALVTGNVVIWRPSPLCQETSALVTDLAVRAGLPDHVLTTLYEQGSDLARRLVADPRVQAVSFTGSTAVGQQIRQTVLQRQGAIQCEMGGKNAAVVVADADLRHAARRIAYGAFGFAGQKCTAVSRVYVEHEVADAFLALLSEAVSALGFGDPQSERTVAGPVISSDKRRELDGVREAALARGIPQLHLELTTVGDSTGGAFFAPTVFHDVPRDDDLMREEFFGPILAVTQVSDLTDAIACVNDSDYGLAACVFTTDRAKARRFAAEAEVGTVKINDSTPGLSVGLPAGGWKGSGAGVGELGDESIRFFTRSTAVIG